MSSVLTSPVQQRSFYFILELFCHYSICFGSTVFYALLNNAGVMVFGETEWQTEKLISLQLDVNLSGAIRVTKHFAPLLRKFKGKQNTYL